MSRVDFYVLRQSGEDARQTFCCKLAEKAYGLDNAVHILVDSERDAATLDGLLWTFRDDSFVPHCRTPETDAPVTIGSSDPGDERTLLINLTDSVPNFANRFERIAEIVTNDSDVKAASRERFTHYRDSGHTIETHKL